MDSHVASQFAGKMLVHIFIAMPESCTVPGEFFGLTALGETCPCVKLCGVLRAMNYSHDTEMVSRSCFRGFSKVSAGFNKQDTTSGTLRSPKVAHCCEGTQLVTYSHIFSDIQHASPCFTTYRSQRRSHILSKLTARLSWFSVQPCPARTETGQLISYAERLGSQVHSRHSQTVNKQRNKHISINQTKINESQQISTNTIYRYYIYMYMYMSMYMYMYVYVYVCIYI